MIVYEPNVTLLPGPYPIGERLRRVAEAGFTTFEVLFPRRLGLVELMAARERYGLRVALINVEPDEANPKGYLSNPAAEEDFWEKLNETLQLARRLDCQRVHVMAGQAIPGLSHEEQRGIVVDRLRRAAPVAEMEGITLLVEALNTIDNPGFFLHSSREGFSIVREVGSPFVRFQYDVYHMQIMEGNLITTIRENVDWIGHVQIADVPGRRQPGAGEVNYPNVLAALEAAGYHGYVGLEYFPDDGADDPFGWLSRSDRGRVLS